MIRIVIMLGIYMYMYVALVFCSLLMRNLFTVLQRVNSSFSHPLLDSFSGDSFFTPWNETSLFSHALLPFISCLPNPCKVCRLCMMICLLPLYIYEKMREGSSRIKLRSVYLAVPARRAVYSTLHASV